MRLVEGFVDVTHRAFEAQLGAVGRDDAARFLAAMLKRVKAEVSQSCSIRVAVDSKHATLFTQLSDLDFSQLSCPGCGLGDYPAMITKGKDRNNK
jgi:hypothetical protein